MTGQVLCECGCGRPAPIAKQTNKRYGHVRGAPVRFIRGHHGGKHRHTREGWQSPTYKSWIAMLLRCENKKHVSYKRYGARGITVCASWHTFASFLKDMGPRPSKAHSLDRYPNKTGNYQPGNVRWATKYEQANNTSSNRMISAFAKTRTLAEWSRELGLHKATLRARLDRAWPIEEALTKPADRRASVCKRGHSRSDSNLYIFKSKSGRQRRVCKECSRLASKAQYVLRQSSSRIEPN